MKKLLLLSVLAFTSIQFSLAQNGFSISPTAFQDTLVSLDDEPFDFRFVSSMNNNSNDTIQLEWELFDVNIPEEWDLSVADNQLEYTPSISQSPIPFSLVGQETNAWFAVYLYPFNVSSCGSFSLRYTDFLTGDTLQTVHYSVGVDNENCFTTGIVQAEIPNLSISPNPASNMLSLSHIEKLESISIIDINGKTILEQNPVTVNSINISNLVEGIYFVHAKDRQNRVSTFKLVKGNL